MVEKSNARKILDEYYKGKLDPELEKIVQGWIVSDESPDKEVELERLFYEYVRYRKPSRKAYRRLKKMHKLLEFDRESVVIPWFRLRVWRVAAALMPLIVAASLTVIYLSDRRNSAVENLVKTNNSVVTEVTTSVLKGNHKFIVLADGTEVTLNEESTFTYGDDRKCKLDGEAYFKVAKSDVPFIIHTDCMDVTVLGTEFNLDSRSKAAICDVALYEGKVKLENKEWQYSLEPGKEFIYNKTSQEARVKNIERGQMQPEWFDSVMNFKGRTLKEIFNTVETYYGVTIKYDHTLDIRQPYSFRFEGNETIEQVMTVLQTISGEFKYRIEVENTIVIETIQ